MNERQYVQNKGWRRVLHTHLLRESSSSEPIGTFGDLHGSLIHEHDQQKHLHPLIEIWEDGNMKFYLFGGAQDLPEPLSGFG